jgi:hypothetical protein
MPAGTPGHGEPSTNTYRSVMYARLLEAHPAILTATPSAVAVGFPHAVHARFLAVMSSVLRAKALARAATIEFPPWTKLSR